MRNKVILPIIIFSSIFLFSCVSQREKIESITDLQGKVFALLSRGEDIENQVSILRLITKADPADIVVYESSSEIFTALKNGEIDAYAVTQFVADYILEKEESLKAIPVTNANIEAQAVMIVRSDEMQLKASLDSAILLLKESGTLIDLKEEWITNLSANKKLPLIDLPRFDGAPTYSIGVAGDLPSLDYVDADGKPAGFNTALYSEIAKILNINFEFVLVKTKDRFKALSSKEIDVIFCHFQGLNADSDEFKDESWIATESYFKYQGGSFLVKK